MRYVDIDLIGVPAFVTEVGPNGEFRMAAINKADEDATGFRECEVAGLRVEECAPPDIAQFIIARLSECVEKRALHEYDERFGAFDDVRWWRTTLTPVIDATSGRIVRIVGISVDITARKQAEGLLANAAFSDPLTGLANRRCIERDVESAITAGRLLGSGFGLVVVDLDGSKPINDTHAHRRGDDVLRHVGSLLKLSLGQDDTAARLGGDEFALKLAASGENDLLKRAGDLSRLLDRDLTIADEPMRIGASVGHALWNGERSFEELFEIADAAMYREKAKRKTAATSFLGPVAGRRSSR